MYIGEASKLTGASQKAIRHYESLGLIAPPKRIGVYRTYSPEDIASIRCIKKAQKYGFKLSEIKEVIHSGNSSEDFEKAIEEKRTEIQREIERLTELHSNLHALQKEVTSLNLSCYS